MLSIDPSSDQTEWPKRIYVSDYKFIKNKAFVVIVVSIGHIVFSTALMRSLLCHGLGDNTYHEVSDSLK